MAKDRTRNARRTEPDSRYEPLFVVRGHGLCGSSSTEAVVLPNLRREGGER